jgi:hypothetical protein
MSHWRVSRSSRTEVRATGLPTRSPAALLFMRMVLDTSTCSPEKRVTPRSCSVPSDVVAVLMVPVQ